MSDDYRNSPNLPRGIRNNNPGNIKYDGTSWQGMSGNDGTFVIFADMGWGVRALARSLTNMIGNGTNTITAIVNQWAPAADSNNVTAYVGSVSGDTGIDPNAILTADPATLALLVRAIANHENGDSYSQQYLTDQDIQDGLAKLNNMVFSTLQAGLVYAQVEPVTALVILGIASTAIYYLTASWKYRKKS